MKTTINLDDDLLKLVKLKALDKDITMTELITKYIKYGLTNDNKIVKLKLNKDYDRYKRKLNK